MGNGLAVRRGLFRAVVPRCSGFDGPPCPAYIIRNSFGEAKKHCRAAFGRKKRLFFSNPRSAIGGVEVVKEFPVSMNRTFVLIACLSSGLALSAHAQTPAAGTRTAAGDTAETAKVGVIAFQVAVAQTNEGQRDFADLQKKFDPRRQQLKSESDEIDTLTKQLQAQASTLSDVEQQARARTIDEKKKKLDRDTQDAQSDFQQAMQDMYNSLASKVYDVMEAYAKLKGFTLVLDISQQQSPVLYASDGTNITKDVIDAYNTKSGIPAPPAQTGVPEAPTPHAPPAAPSH